jgi:RimJ/RimL family protein N-acetyltransferase
MVEIVSKGRHVILRSKILDDADDDYKWRTDSQLAELDATVSLKMSFEEFIKHFQREIDHPMVWVRRYAVDTLDGIHIGNCMAYDISTVSGEAEIGILIGHRGYWGSGYGSDAVCQLLGIIFDMPTIRRVYLHTLDWNIRARRAFAGCGFREVRPVRRAGKDFIRMEITRAKWDELGSGV